MGSKTTRSVSWDALLAAAASAAALSACGSANLLSGNDEHGLEPPRPLAVRTFAGSRNVSHVAGLEPSYESQSAAAVLDQRAFIAYRAGDPDYTSYFRSASGDEDQRVCPGASQLAYSVGDPATGVFERVRVPVPAQMALLWGPVAVATFQGRVVASALASPSSRFADLANDEGCVRTSVAAGSSLPASLPATGALTAACLLPLTGGEASCVSRGGAVLEGGSLAATEQHLYAAYRDATRQSLVLYRSSGASFAELAAPAVRVDGDVLIASTATRLFVVYEAGAELRLLRFDESSRTWEAPLVVAQDVNRRYVPGGRSRAPLSIQGFTLGVLQGEPPELAVFWQRRVGSTERTTLRGALCETKRGGGCRAPQHLRAANSRDNFLPSVVSVAERGSGGSVSYRHFLSYWRGTRSRSGRLGLRVAEFDAHSLQSRWLAEETQAPCPLRGGREPADWGRADASFVMGQGTNAPAVYRAFTDSTQGACDARAFRASPQHVSVVRLGGAITPAR